MQQQQQQQLRLSSVSLIHTVSVAATVSLCNAFGE
jgi:hypothetical protein